MTKEAKCAIVVAHDVSVLSALGHMQRAFSSGLSSSQIWGMSVGLSGSSLTERTRHLMV